MAKQLVNMKGLQSAPMLDAMLGTLSETGLETL